MSAWVITPSGVVAEYPAVNYFQWINHGEFCCKLFNGDPDKGGVYVGSAPKGSVVSFREPRGVRVTPGANVAAIEAAVQIAEACIEQYPTLGIARQRTVASLKKKLKRYDARSKRWK